MKTYYVLNLVQHHEDEWGNGGTSPRILNFDTGRKWVVSFELRSSLYWRICPGC